MSESSSEKYLYFTVGLLKGSAALDALRQDATKHHMVDQPGQLIALRLTEYYEMMNQGIVQPVVRVPAVLLSAGKNGAVGKEFLSPQEQMTTQEHPVGQRPSAASLPVATPPVTHVHHATPTSPVPIRPHLHPVEDPPGSSTARMRALHRENDEVVRVSAAAEQNADDAADYWSTL